MKIKWIITSLVLLSCATGCSSFLYYPTHVLYSQPDEKKISVEDVWFNNQDGTKLNGWYFKHKGTVAAKGMFVFFHGNGENLSSHYQSLLWVLDYGYDFFIFDYQGYGRSQGDTSPEGTIKDGKAAIRWAKEKAQSTPLIIFGQSLGGAIALKTVIDLRGEITPKLVVVESTFPSYQGVARKVLSSSFLTWLFQPFAYVLLSDKYAPGEDIGLISPVPLVVIHGTDDKTVDISFGRKCFEYAKEPKEFWEVAGGEHTDTFWKFGSVYKPRLLQKLESLK